MAKIWFDLCDFYSKVIFWNFCLKKYFVLFFFAEFELLMFHDNIVKNSEKIEQAELVENLPPSYFPYRFLHNVHITKTRLYSFDPLKPHFYTIKLEFTAVYINFLICAETTDCEYSLEPPRRGGSSEYQQSMFWAQIWKISDFLI